MLSLWSAGGLRAKPQQELRPVVSAKWRRRRRRVWSRVRGLTAGQPLCLGQQQRTE
jgi:hypothetical protein